ncbi:putative serine/threonine-protein kinase PkwA [Yarrowia sp. E02]|nr:putative serine/threonine-protein kinase PkwA [Yarrowia sp. E02]
MDWIQGYLSQPNGAFPEPLPSPYHQPVNPQFLFDQHYLDSSMETSSPSDTEMDLDMDLDVAVGSHYMRDVAIRESAAAEGVDEDRPDCFFKFLEEEFRQGTLSSELYQRSVYKTVDFPAVVTPQVLREHPILDKQGLEWGTLFESGRRGSFLIPDGVCESVATHKALVRKLRYQRYAAYRPPPGVSPTIPGSEYSLLAFQRCFTAPKPHLFHFQLRNLMYPVSSTQVFYNANHMDDFQVDMLNPETGEQTVAISPDMCDPSLQQLRVSALAANRNVVMLGSTKGVFVVKPLSETAPSEKKTVLPSGMISSGNELQVNYISLLSSSALISGNDNILRTLDLTSLKAKDSISLPHAANATAFLPGSESVCVMACDSPESHVYDTRSGKLQMSLQGHTDFGFACAWSPDGKTVATGNQDGTCRLYDIRGASNQCIGAVSGKLQAAIRSVDFDASGRYLAMAEPVDYVTVVDTWSECAARQTIEFFGGTAGVRFTQSCSAGEYQQLTIGVADETVGGVIQYLRPSQMQGEDFGFL